MIYIVNNVFVIFERRNVYVKINMYIFFFKYSEDIIYCVNYLGEIVRFSVYFCM